MKQKLPVDQYSWLSEDEIKKFDIKNVDLDKDIGYIICCDLQYPEHLHDLHDAFPMAPVSTDICFDDLSPLAKKLFNTCFPEKNSHHKCRKLIASFNPRINYVAHAKCVQYYVKSGLQVTKISKILKFRQVAFLSTFIDLCTSLRQQANNDFEKNLFKLMANSSYGKHIFYFT